jgi:hypothetical protein
MIDVAEHDIVAVPHRHQHLNQFGRYAPINALQHAEFSSRSSAIAAQSVATLIQSVRVI